MRKRLVLILMAALLGQSVSIWAEANYEVFPEKNEDVADCVKDISENEFLSEEKGRVYLDNQENHSEVLDATVSDNIVLGGRENNSKEILPEQNVSVNDTDNMPEQAISANNADDTPEQAISVNGMDDISDAAEDVNEEGKGLSSDSVSMNGNEEIQQDSQEEAVSGNISSNISSNTVSQKKSRESVSAGEKKQEDKEIIKVSMPGKVKVCFDPYNLEGKGGIFSEKYEIANYGNQDVAVKINSVHVRCDYSEDKCQFIRKSDMNVHSKKKIVNMDMVWVNESEHLEKVLNVADGRIEEYVIYLKAAEYDENGKFIKLGEGSKGEFFFEGELNSNSDAQWMDEKISVDYKYEIVSCGEDNIQRDIEDFIKSTKNVQIPYS